MRKRLSEDDRKTLSLAVRERDAHANDMIKCNIRDTKKNAKTCHYFLTKLPSKGHSLHIPIVSCGIKKL